MPKWNYCCKVQAADLGGQCLLMLIAKGATIFLKQIKFLKMKTTKMSLATIQGKLSRAEMKKIMAGSGPGNGGRCIGSVGEWTGGCSASIIKMYCRSGAGECY
jgi:hypothetical protein